jgi:xeroderma pigmentosum group C-complementing protein
MPPHLPRKRLRTPSPVRDGRVTKAKPATKAASARQQPRKTTLFEALEAGTKNRSAEKTRSALQQMHDDDDDESSCSLTSLSDAEFEEVPAAKRRKTEEPADSSEEEDIEFEDVPSHELKADPVPSGDLELTLYQDDSVPRALNEGKKGPSKRQKHIRNMTHCIHVQFLMWHNAIRNSWLCDQEVQAILLSHLPPRLAEEVDRWRLNSGLVDVEKPIPAKSVKGKGKGKGKTRGKQPAKPKSARDWGDAAARLERGVPDMSHGDPLFRLMKVLTSWWKQRFTITAPGLRKIGYMDIRRLAKIRGSFHDDEHDPEKFGERIKNIEEFREHAQGLRGSRDVGAQLFTGLLRAIGIEARMVANLQCLGYGWTKAEDADEERPGKALKLNGTAEANQNEKQAPKKQAKTKTASTRPASRRARKGDRDALKMDLDDSDEFVEPISDDSDDSVVELTTSVPVRRPTLKVYDRDLEFPHYWTEVLSPVTQKYLVVDAIVKSAIGTSRESVELLEPRGAKADKAKQVMAYVVGHSPDGTAKDVTVRYLKKQVFPGRTKGFRLPVEKVPVYNKHGKVKRHEQFDWFKSVLRGYTRGTQKHPVTEVDEAEEALELTPIVPEKKEFKEGEETLQYYKSSKEYVLARHLRREEALLPGAAPVKVFRNKGKGGKIDEEDVFLRKDVVAVKSAETWHKQGRAPFPDAQPLKHAPYRAATTNRRRELAEMEARTGEKVLQPLYSLEQTDWIIPDPIQNGVIPKNEYGNIDMFAEHMCPEGAIHLPYRGAVRVCKRLGIDFAEAVVGFEFGHRMAVPVIQGVVVAEEHQEQVLEEVQKDEAEKARKEDEKRRKASLNMWRKLLMGLRIADRLRLDHGDMEDIEVIGHEKRDEQGSFEAMRERDEERAGGFLPDEYEVEEVEKDTALTSSAYFHHAPIGEEHDLKVESGIAQVKGPNRKDEDDDSDLNEENEEDGNTKPAKEPVARRMQSNRKAKANAQPAAPRRRRRLKDVSPDQDEDEESESELSELDDSDSFSP